MNDLVVGKSGLPTTKQKKTRPYGRTYSRVPGHKNYDFDPASVFRSTHWWRQHPACQRCFYKPLRNCHPSQRVSTPPRARGNGGASALEPPRATRIQRELIRTGIITKIQKKIGKPGLSRGARSVSTRFCGLKSCFLSVQKVPMETKDDSRKVELEKKNWKKKLVWKKNEKKTLTL